MKSLFSTSALSARRRVTHQIHSFLLNVASLINVTVFALILSSCQRETNAQSEIKKTQANSSPKPRVDIKVNRRYDDKGNMIGFDSIYSSYYSNLNGDTARTDSLMGIFDRFFRKEHSSLLSHQFDPLFFNDSTRDPDFFHDDFFIKRYELNDPYFRGMMYHMDSIKNDFYRMDRRKQKKPKS